MPYLALELLPGIVSNSRESGCDEVVLPRSFDGSIRFAPRQRIGPPQKFVPSKLWDGSELDLKIKNENQNKTEKTLSSGESVETILQANLHVAIDSYHSLRICFVME